MGQILYAVVNSGQTVSGNIDVSKGVVSHIIAPTITSGDLFLQGNVDTTSANFFRMQNPPVNSGHLRLATGAGSAMMTLAGLLTPPWLRLEAAVTQTDVRTFTLLVR